LFIQLYIARVGFGSGSDEKGPDPTGSANLVATDEKDVRKWIGMKNIGQEIWSRGVELPVEVKDELCASLRHPYLATVARSLPTLGPNSFNIHRPNRRRLKSIYTCDEK